MRKNLPVTATEQPIRDGESIVSKTDLQGNITYVNPYFIEVSGFSEEELMGAPQNIIRHPDMPVEAFADLWSTLRAGEPWNGLVKNRCKNGNYYWISANVVPVREGGQTVGYMSVRTKAERKAVEAAEAGYRQFREGRASGLAIRRGAIVRTGPAGWLRAFGKLSLGTRINAGMGFLTAVLIALGASAISTHTGESAGWLAGLTAAAVTASLYIWCSIHRFMLAPLRRAIATARAIAGGDLTQRCAVKGHDEMGQLLRALEQTNVNLTAVIRDVADNVGAIRTNTGEIAQGNMDLSQRTEAQASSLEETAASMEEFSSTVKQNAEHASEANTLAVQACAVARDGGAAVDSMVATMQDISQSSSRIADIIGMIDAIAFQTNILALNAAVEAARAGEQGRGFAVVASEVRSLAQRSAAAAKEIKELIDASAGKVQQGTSLAAGAGATMRQVVGSIERLATLMGDISTASREQSTGIEQVNQAVTEMDQNTQQNAALVEQAAAAAATLNEQARQLDRAMSVFKSGESKSAPASAAAPRRGAKAALALR